MQTVELNRSVEQVREEVIHWRRFLHAHPELSFEEEKTSQFVFDTLLSFGNLELSRPTKTSVMARLIGKQPGKVIAIRADMDALPIAEENNFDFASCNPGVMHACGHDGHTAMLLGAAKILSSLQDQIKGEIRFIFQHAEELPPGGAEEMVAAGVMDGVDQVIGAHLWSTMETGKFGFTVGPMMASYDTFDITIHGKGGHAALPHQTIDSIVVGTQVVTNLQQIVSRNTDPLDQLVISITKFIGGTTHNVIPNSVLISGTTRCFDSEIRKSIPVNMERVIQGITSAHGATYEFKYNSGYRPVVNEENVTRLMEETVAELYGEETILKMRANMGSEDFSAYQQKAPGCFFYIGAGNREKDIVYPHHHPRFTVDEDALEIGVRVFVNAAFKLLG